VAIPVVKDVVAHMLSIKNLASAEFVSAKWHIVVNFPELQKHLGNNREKEN